MSGVNMGRHRRQEPPAVPLSSEPCWCGRFAASDGRVLAYTHALGDHPEFWEAHTAPRHEPPEALVCLTCGGTLAPTGGPALLWRCGSCGAASGPL